MAKQTNNYSKNNFYFDNFSSREDFIDTSVKQGATKKVAPQTFSDQTLLQETMAFFDVEMAKVDMGGAFEKARLKTTADPRGIFDFSLAAQGLYRPQEYYSEELANDSPDEFNNSDVLPGIVPPDNVYKNDLEQFWYKSEETNKKYLLTQQQEGTLAVDLGLKQQKVFKTTVKKSYVMFEKKKGKAKYVDLYIPFSAASNLTQEGMLTRILPMLLVAKKLESVQIRTKINMIRMYSEDKSGAMQYIGLSYPIKDYGDDLDFDWISTNAADTVWFNQLGSYAVNILKQKNNNINWKGYGYPTASYNEVLEVFNRYRNWYFEEAEKGSQPIVRVDRNLMIAGGVQAPTNNFKADSEKVIEEYFRILDLVDFQFNDAEKAAKRVYTRMVDKEGKSVIEFKTYVQRLLNDAYSYPNAGQYKTEQEQIDKLEDGYDKGIEGLNKYLESI
jgi:hypothetical protein